MSGVSVRLTLAQWQVKWIEKQARHRGVSMSEYLRQLILEAKMNLDESVGKDSNDE
jgi:hypothetical protein